MQTIPNLPSQDTYVKELTLEDPGAVAGAYIVANAAVYAQFKPKGVGATTSSWGPDLLLPPQTNNVVGLTGMRFRSAVAGVPAQVIAVVYDKDDPLPGSPTPFLAGLTATGGITPAEATVQVEHNGTLVGVEAAVDFEDGQELWTVTDDVPNGRVKVFGQLAPGAAAGGAINGSTLGNIGTAFPTTGLYLGYRYTLLQASPAAGSQPFEFVYRPDLNAANPWLCCGGGPMPLQATGTITNGGLTELTTAVRTTILRTGVYSVRCGIHLDIGQELHDGEWCQNFLTDAASIASWVAYGQASMNGSSGNSSVNVFLRLGGSFEKEQVAGLTAGKTYTLATNTSLPSGSRSAVIWAMIHPLTLQ